MNAPNQLRDIFDRAIEISSPEQRAKFIESACGDNEDLRLDIEQLLDAHTEAGDFLQPPVELQDVATLAPADPDPRGFVPGDVVGKYRLVRKLGTGGFGLVFLAEQFNSLRRQVAIKLIKPGMDSQEIIARFNHERQALALMDHMNIARILDAGTTEQGRPYFVMEYVDGVPITEYCESKKLTLTERLNLFLEVCKAIQHAHQKGLIHRDLKPSNILVNEQAGKPVPKIIDFGIAKALGQSITEDEVRTRGDMLIGTPLYMSPEQAARRSRDVDARSDIFSLGVLLFELLTGSTPIRRRALSELEFDDVLALVREREAPVPSRRLVEDETDVNSIAHNRQTTPGRLIQFVKGDLDWIIHKALEKDRDRRYGSVDALGMDVARFLSNEPIAARPPSMSYRVKKFIQKNRTLVNFSLTMAGVLVMATSISVWQAIKATQNEGIALRALAAEKRAVAAERAAVYARTQALAEARIQFENNMGFVSTINEMIEQLEQSQDTDVGESELKSSEGQLRKAYQDARNLPAEVVSELRVRAFQIKTAEVLVRLARLTGNRQAQQEWQTELDRLMKDSGVEKVD